MAKVVIYTSNTCPYCERAKRLLKQKNAAYEEINISVDEVRRAEMLQRTGGRQSVPQIFINEQHVGGSDDLYALEREGKLDALLAA